MSNIYEQAEAIMKLTNNYNVDREKFLKAIDRNNIDTDDADMLIATLVNMLGGKLINRSYCIFWVMELWGIKMSDIGVFYENKEFGDNLIR